MTENLGNIYESIGKARDGHTPYEDDMPEIVLLNIHDKNKLGNFTGKIINCMRPFVLGNPFYMKNTSIGERHRVISEFKEYLWQKMQSNNPVNAELRRLAALTENIALVCCCTPKACHTDVIKSAIEWIRSR